MESINDDNAQCIKLEDGQKLNLWRRISFYWKEEPADDILSIILPRPAGSECESSLMQIQTNLSQLNVSSRPQPQSLHRHLWKTSSPTNVRKFLKVGGLPLKACPSWTR
jgi:hypothetical protein